MEAIIKENIIEYPYAEEWMIGKKVRVLEQFPEDGEQFALVELHYFTGPANVRFPMRYLEPIDAGDGRPVDVRTVDTRTGSIHPVVEPKAEHDPQCIATTKSGNRCKGKAIKNGLCAVHGSNKRKKVVHEG